MEKKKKLIEHMNRICEGNSNLRQIPVPDQKDRDTVSFVTYIKINLVTLS